MLLVLFCFILFCIVLFYSVLIFLFSLLQLFLFHFRVCLIFLTHDSLIFVMCGCIYRWFFHSFDLQLTWQSCAAVKTRRTIYSWLVLWLNKNELSQVLALWLYVAETGLLVLSLRCCLIFVLFCFIFFLFSYVFVSLHFLFVFIWFWYVCAPSHCLFFFVAIPHLLNNNDAT